MFFFSWKTPCTSFNQSEFVNYHYFELFGYFSVFYLVHVFRHVVCQCGHLKFEIQTFPWFFTFLAFRVTDESKS